VSADTAIVQVAIWTAVLAAGYLAVGALATALRAHPRAAKGVVGLGLVTCLATGGVALAAPADTGTRRSAAVSVDWPISAGEHPDRQVVVQPGDCLWSIAARLLDQPTPTRIAASWPRWWHSNRRVVGPDPNLIHPGQRLRPPVPVRSRS
jgi:nucleoid-associated protein YgaU